MIGPGLEGSTFNAYAYSFDQGLAGALTTSIEDSNGNVIVAPQTADIIEIDAGGTSVYRWIGVYPPIGEYIIIWEDPDGIQAAEELVTGSEVGFAAEGPRTGPCQDWITAEEVADCCGIVIGTDSEADLENAATLASELLYRLSLKKFSGLCIRTVRPCRVGCACNFGEEDWRWATTSWMHPSGRTCGCGCVSQITLSGTVRAIVEIKIDGVLIAPDEYRVDEFKYLVRMADADGVRQRWPSCQRLDLPSTEDGTFEVTYLSGLDVPALGAAAASALACELYRACPGSAGECALPAGVTRIVRQGLVIEKIDSLAMLLRRGATGIVAIDTFIAAFNPTGASAVPTIWSPDMPRSRRIG